MPDTISLWKAVTNKDKVPHFFPLKENMDVNVAIIGTGITGLTTAWHLAKHGKSVALVDANDTVGGVTTPYSTGNLYVATQSYYQNIIKKFDEKIAKIVASSRETAIKFIADIVQENNIHCHFSPRPWFVYADEKQINFLEKEVEAMKKIGLDINYVTEMPLPFKFKKAAAMQNQARLNPFQYGIALADILHKHGCHIYQKTQVNYVEEKKTRCILHTTHGKIHAEKVVVATHTPIGINPVQLFTAPYRSYVVAAKLKDNHYPEGHFWDLSAPHHATCTHPITGDHPQCIMVAGNHHKTGQDKNAIANFSALKYFLNQHFDVADIIYEWSAQHYQAADDVPYIGLRHGSKNIYEATGYFADGLVYGTVAGLIIADAIVGNKNIWAEAYRVSRFKPLASASFVFKEQANVFVQYLKDFPTKSKTEKTFSEIEKGQGKVVEIDQEKYAIARDHNNKVHVVCAVCPHMKCIVNWNNAEQTWDCPCHGSRFEIDGKYIEGPATQDLTPYKE